jgi:uncharacterized damage-inducible protein DinB
MENPYEFLTQTFETEILKTLTIWQAFPDDQLGFRPAPKARTVAEQMEHQLKSEYAWMKKMFGIDTGDELPTERTRSAYIAKYRADAGRRLAALRAQPAAFWAEPVAFFDVTRPRAWVMLRRIAHSAHHRGQLIIYLRLLGRQVPSVYGPTADTGDKVLYRFEAERPRPNS